MLRSKSSNPFALFRIILISFVFVREAIQDARCDWPPLGRVLECHIGLMLMGGLLCVIGKVIRTLTRLTGQTNKRSSTKRAVPKSPQPKKLRAAPRSHQTVQTSAWTKQEDWTWISPGVRVEIGGHAIPGGMLYVGTHMQSLSAAHAGNDPALIHPSLPIARASVSNSGASKMGYWPSYSSILPANRTVYLAWLADGRRDPGTDIGCVFLFFYGLERRALADAREHPEARAELPAIAAEVRRLLGIYGGNASFRGYASSFVRALDVLGADPTSTAQHEFAWEEGVLPPGLDVALSQSAIAQAPLPANWALV